MHSITRAPRTNPPATPDWRPPPIASPASGHGSKLRTTAGPVLDDFTRLDLAIYRTIAATPTPRLDEPMRRLSNLANHSKLWLLIAAAMGGVGGRAGRKAGIAGGAAIVINSVIVNLVVKRAGRRARSTASPRPFPAARHVTMPTSPSFPSGHTASGFAFAAAQAGVAPLIAAPLPPSGHGGGLLPRPRRCALPRRRCRRCPHRHHRRRVCRTVAPIDRPSRPDSVVTGCSSRSAVVPYRVEIGQRPAADGCACRGETPNMRSRSSVMRSVVSSTSRSGWSWSSWPRAIDGRPPS